MIQIYISKITESPIPYIQVNVSNTTCVRLISQCPPAHLMPLYLEQWYHYPFGKPDTSPSSPTSKLSSILQILPLKYLPNPYTLYIYTLTMLTQLAVFLQRCNKMAHEFVHLFNLLGFSQSILKTQSSPGNDMYGLQVPKEQGVQPRVWPDGSYCRYSSRHAPNLYVK